MKHKEENEIPKHKRKKGKKHFVIQRKITNAEAYRLMQKEHARIAKEMHWVDGWSKYETKKQAEQALEDIERKKKNTHARYCYERGYNHKIVDKSEK